MAFLTYEPTEDKAQGTPISTVGAEIAEKNKEVRKEKQNAEGYKPTAEFINYDPYKDDPWNRPDGMVKQQEWTAGQEWDYIENFRDKGLNTKYTINDLRSQGVPENVVQKIYNPGNMPTIEEQALEYSILPGTPLGHAANKTGEVAFGLLAKSYGILKNFYQTKGMSQENVTMIETAYHNGDLKTLKAIEDKLFGIQRQKHGNDALVGENETAFMPTNFFERRRFYTSRVPDIKAQMLDEIEQIVPGSSNLNKLVDDAVQKYYGKSKKIYKDAYKKVDDAGDDKFRYNFKDMREDLLNKLREDHVPEPVIKAIKRNLFYHERNLTPVQKGALKRLNSMSDNGVIEAAELKVATATTGTQAKANAVEKLARLKAEEAKLTGIMPNLDELGEKEFIRLIDEVNRKKNISGADISKGDTEEMRGLQNAKRYLEDAFEKATLETNPDIAPLFKNARREFARHVGIFGQRNQGNANFPELGKMVKKPFDQGSEISVGEQIDSMLKSPMKIKEISRRLKEVDEEAPKQIAEEWLARRLGNTKLSQTGVLQKEGADLQSLVTQLSNVVSDKKGMEFIGEILGPQRVKDLKSQFSLVSGLKKFADDMTKKGDGKNLQSAGSYIMDGKGVLTRTGRTIKMLIEKFKDKGGDGGYSREILEKTQKLVETYQKKIGTNRQHQAERDLARWLEEELPTALALSERDMARRGIPGVQAAVNKANKPTESLGIKPPVAALIDAQQTASDPVREKDPYSWSGMYSKVRELFN